MIYEYVPMGETLAREAEESAAHHRRNAERWQAEGNSEFAGGSLRKAEKFDRKAQEYRSGQWPIRLPN